jgi:dihydroxyacid dehydratase/phosphogluconate dehydratase
LLVSIGRVKEEDLITFDVFARCVALMLEDQAEKVSTSSQQNVEEDQYEMADGEEYYQQYYGQEMPEGQEGYGDEEYYNEDGNQ